MSSCSLLRILIPEQVHTQIVVSNRKDPHGSSPQSGNLPAQIPGAVLLVNTHAQYRAHRRNHHRIADHHWVIAVRADVVAGVDGALFRLLGFLRRGAFGLVVVFGGVVVDV